MEKELLNNEKQLLLQDLSERLPYKVKIQGINSDNETVVEELFTIGIEEDIFDCNMIEYVSVKPYLFPLSSMTEEQKNQLERLWSDDMDKAMDYAISGEERFSGLCELSAARKVIDWLIANHFDYRGLIPMGLANDATGLNIY